MSIDTTHECPKPGCDVRVPFEILACRSHWFEISRATRDLLSHLWRRAPGTDRYFEARARALLELGVPAGDVADLNGGVGAVA